MIQRLPPLNPVRIRPGEKWGVKQQGLRRGDGTLSHVNAERGREPGGAVGPRLEWQFDTTFRRRCQSEPEAEGGGTGLSVTAPLPQTKGTSRIALRLPRVP